MNMNKTVIEDKIFRLNCAEVTRLKSPYKTNNKSPFYVYHAYIDAKKLPTGIPTDVNPRETNMKTKVARTIIDNITSDTETFYLNNRGIFISAKAVDWTGKNLVVNLGDDNNQYGILDGGHTYRAVIENKKNIPEDITQFVHLEIATNISDIETIDELASARNNSVQVSDKAIAELANKFDFVKNQIKDEPYADRIAYKQNQDKNKFDIDATDLIRLMFAMNAIYYPNKSLAQPVQAYSGKAQVLKHFLKENEKENDSYKKLAPLLPEMINLYDKIEKEMPTVYQKLNGKSSRFGRVKGVEPKETRTKFLKNKVNHAISQGLILPIFAGFRYLVDSNEKNFSWKINPIAIWDQVKDKLVNNTIEMSRSLGNNPQAAGKNTSLWQQNYDAVKAQYLENKE